MGHDTLTQMESIGLVPVVVLDSAGSALPTADALCAGGVPVMEVTLRTDAALASLEKIASARPGVLLGAGTVLTLDQCKSSVSAGARFIVSPGFSPAIVEWCLAEHIPVIPGCVTPTEIMAGLALGLTVFKYFPANLYGGLKGMKSLSAPFGGVRFVPTGGVSGDNLSEYVSAPFVYAVGGSWLCAARDIREGRFDEITRLCRQAVEITASARREKAGA